MPTLMSAPIADPVPLPSPRPEQLGGSAFRGKAPTADSCLRAADGGHEGGGLLPQRWAGGRRAR